MRILDKNPPRWDAWHTTHWSLVRQLDDQDTPERETSWEWLFQNYRGPMERYARRTLSRRTGRPWSQQDAEEVVQDFLVSCIEKRWLSRARRGPGRFRAFVQKILKDYCHRYFRDATTAKKHPARGVKVFSLREGDEDTELTAEDRMDIEDFDRSWAQVAIERAIQRLRGSNPRYGTVLIDLIETDGKGSPDLMERVKISRSGLRVLKTHVRDRFNEIFVEELRDTVESQEDFEEEWRALAPYLERRRPRP